ncbi:hypothetical protein ACWGOQ_0017535 [Aquimarina sp. M1]
MKKNNRKRLSLDKIKIARLNNMKEISGGFFSMAEIDTETNIINPCTSNITDQPTTSTKTIPIGSGNLPSGDSE